MQIKDLGCAELHPGGEFVGLNSGLEAGVGGIGGQVGAVEFLEQGEAVAIRLRGDVAGGSGRAQIGDGRGAGRVDDRALVGNGQKAGAEIAFLVVGQSFGVGQNDERG